MYIFTKQCQIFLFNKMFLASAHEEWCFLLSFLVFLVQLCETRGHTRPRTDPAVFIWHHRRRASFAERVSFWSAWPVSTTMSWIWGGSARHSWLLSNTRWLKTTRNTKNSLSWRVGFFSDAPCGKHFPFYRNIRDIFVLGNITRGNIRSILISRCILAHLNTASC